MDFRLKGSRRGLMRSATVTAVVGVDREARGCKECQSGVARVLIVAAGGGPPVVPLLPASGAGPGFIKNGIIRFSGGALPWVSEREV